MFGDLSAVAKTERQTREIFAARDQDSSRSVRNQFAALSTTRPISSWNFLVILRLRAFSGPAIMGSVTLGVALGILLRVRSEVASIQS